MKKLNRTKKQQHLIVRKKVAVRKARLIFNFHLADQLCEATFLNAVEKGPIITGYEDPSNEETSDNTIIRPLYYKYQCRRRRRRLIRRGKND